MGLNQFDAELGSAIVYTAVRDALIHAGVDQSSHPYTSLTAASQLVWMDAWNRIVNELAEREYVFAKWSTLMQMFEGDPVVAMWRSAQKDLPLLEGETRDGDPASKEPSDESS